MYVRVEYLTLDVWIKVVLLHTALVTELYKSVAIDVMGLGDNMEIVQPSVVPHGLVGEMVHHLDTIEQHVVTVVGKLGDSFVL